MPSGPPIYFDHNATSPLLPEVRTAVLAALDGSLGNASSIHAPGRRARAALETARHDVAALVGGLPDEIVFTSGGTEGDNLAVRGLAQATAGRGKRIVATRIEHPAVLGALAALQGLGFIIEWLPVDPDGRLAPATLRAALAQPTALVTVALANHEIGTVQPIVELAALAHAAGALFHTDAVQAVGRMPVDVRGLGVDALTLSAHKLGGPQGAGAIWVRAGLLPEPLVAGGHQERERRAGTENVPGLVGFGAACRVARAELEARSHRVARLRDRLEARLLTIAGARRHGAAEVRVPGTCNVGFRGAAGDLVAIGLDLEGVAVSTGAACTSGSLEPSPVLLALGLSAAEAREAVRFSLGVSNTEAEVDRVAELCTQVVARVRAAA